MIMNKNTAEEYQFRLTNFEKFLLSYYKTNLDGIVLNLRSLSNHKKEKLDPYKVLGDYCVFLQETEIDAGTLKNRVVTAKNFLE
jgi:hypothetical protein